VFWLEKQFVPVLFNQPGIGIFGFLRLGFPLPSFGLGLFSLFLHSFRPLLINSCRPV
jgi:hypothetical protein